MDMDSVLEPLRQESTSEIIAGRIREAIVTGDFKAGDQLGEAALASQLGVSRGPLREAMQRLVQEGILHGVRHRGIFVAEHTIEDVADIYLARTAVERSACLKVIELDGRGPEVGAKLLKIVERMEARAQAGASPAELTALDVRFHELQVAEAHSPRLSRMHATLVAETRMCLSTLEDTGYSAADRVAEHRGIAAAIQDGNVSVLHGLLARHMDEAVEHITARMLLDGAPGAGAEQAV